MGKKRMRKRYEAAFTARVALAAIRGDKTLSELASAHPVRANLISRWKRRLLNDVARVFEEPADDARQDHQAWSKNSTRRSASCTWSWTG